MRQRRYQFQREQQQQQQDLGCPCFADPGETDREADAERQIAIEMARQQGWVIVGGTAFLLHVEPSQRVFGFGELDVHAQGDAFTNAQNLVQMLSISFPYRQFRAVPTGTGAQQTVRVIGRSQVIADITGVQSCTPHQICMSHPLFRGCLVIERAYLVENLQTMLANPELFFRHEKDFARLHALLSPPLPILEEPQEVQDFETQVQEEEDGAAQEDVGCQDESQQGEDEGQENVRELQDASVQVTAQMVEKRHKTTMTCEVFQSHTDCLRAELDDMRGRLEEAQNELQELQIADKALLAQLAMFKSSVVGGGGAEVEEEEEEEEGQEEVVVMEEDEEDEDDKGDKGDEEGDEDVLDNTQMAEEELARKNTEFPTAEETTAEDRLSGMATPPKFSTSTLSPRRRNKKKNNKNKNNKSKKQKKAPEAEENKEKKGHEWKASFQERIAEYERRQRAELEERLAAAKRLANKMIDRARTAESKAEELEERLGDFKDVANLLMQQVVDLNAREASCARLIPLVTTAFPLPGTVRVSSSEMFGQSNVLFINQFASDFVQLTDVMTRCEMAVKSLYHDCVRDTLLDPHANSIDPCRSTVSVRITGKCNLHAPSEEAFYGPQHPMRNLFQLERMEKRRGDVTLRDRLDEAYIGLEPSLAKLLMEPYFAVERDYLQDKVEWPLMVDVRICLRIDCTGYLDRIAQ
jgi:hypothetical protein